MNKSMEKWNGTRGIAESGVLKPLSETAYRRYRSFNNKPVDLIALIVARTMPSTIFRPEFTTIRMEKKIKIDRVEERNGSEQVFPQRYSVELK